MNSLQTPNEQVKPMNETKAADQTALAKASPRVIEGEIVDADGYNQQVVAWQKQGFAVLTPAAALSSIPKDHKVLVSQVRINPNPAFGEVYQNPMFTRDGEVALTKPGLEKIAQCAGIGIDEISRVDSGTVEHVWSYRVRGHWIGFDGTRIDRIATKTLDLRDGSPDLKGFTAKQIEQARRHGEAVCESKAINRLYRTYGLRQKYSQRELADRPFIVLKLQWEPDMTNPIVAALVTQQKLGATGALYAPGLPQAINPSELPAHQVPPEMRKGAPAQEVADEDERPVGASNEVPFDDEDDSPELTVASVTQAGGSDDFFVTFEGGLKLHTSDRTIAKTCNDARKAGRKLRITREASELTEIRFAGPVPQATETAGKY